MVDSNQTLIKMQGVKKVFYTDEVETHALQDIHLEIKQGEYVAIAGPSGCGKSTLLSILGLLDTPATGVHAGRRAGRAISRLSERARIRNREIGFIFQAFNLIGDLTVYENVELPLTYRGMSAAERKQSVQTRSSASAWPPHEALSGAALRRSAAARRRGARRGRRSAHPARRRADGKPRLDERRSGDGAASRAASQRRDDLHGHARPALRRPRRSLASTCSTDASSKKPRKRASAPSQN